MSYINNERDAFGRHDQGSISDPKWRRRHSAWLLAPILGAGILTFVGFLYVAARTRKKQWWKFALGYTLASALIMVLMETTKSANGSGSDWGSGLAMTVWFGGIVHASLLNREWLRWRATSQPWYANSTNPDTTTPAPVRLPLPPQIANLGVDPANYYAPGPPAQTTTTAQPAPAPSYAGPPVDVNTATEAQLAQLPGITADIANKITALRKTSGGFADVDDLARKAGLEPHQLVRLRPYVTATTPPEDHIGPRQPNTGRILDI